MSNGKMLYAYLKVMDPNTSLPKSVLVNWVSIAVYLYVCLIYLSIGHCSVVPVCLLCINFLFSYYSVIINWNILFTEWRECSYLCKGCLCQPCSTGCQVLSGESSYFMLMCGIIFNWVCAFL